MYKNPSIVIEEALSAVRLKLQLPSNSSAVDIPREQLLRVERELSNMLEVVCQRRTGTDHAGLAGLARMVVDSWPLQHELSELVCAVVHAYSSAMRDDSPLTPD